MRRDVQRTTFRGPPSLIAFHSSGRRIDYSRIRFTRIKTDQSWLGAFRMSPMYNPAHPGEVLQEWLEGISVTEAARKLGVTRAALSRILHGHAGISADMALRLAESLETSPELWLGMQTAWELWQAKQKPRPHVEKLLSA
ncbi:HigA family addiction module antitoxin [Chromobacterium subtsugae]